MKVMKFGGTSVGSPERIKHVAELICDGQQNFVVLSAMSGTTNVLYQITDAMCSGKTGEAISILMDLTAKYYSYIDELYDTEASKESIKSFYTKEFDYIRHLINEEPSATLCKTIVGQGEIISTNMMNIYLVEKGVDVAFISALDFMRTDENDEPMLDVISFNLKEKLSEIGDHQLYLTQGFICKGYNGEFENLQRGGSDYTASLIGAALKVDEIQIWTDIDGMHNNDPRIVDNTSPVHQLHFEEASELAYFGAKILHPTCILPARKANVPVRLLNTMEPQAEGTTINNLQEESPIKAIAAKDGITVIKIKSSRMLMSYGFLMKVFEAFSKYKTPVDMVCTSEVGVSITIDNTSNLGNIISCLSTIGDVSTEKDMSIICVVGNMEWGKIGFQKTVLNAVGDIPIRMVNYGGSNYNMSFLVSQNDKDITLKNLSEKLF